MTRHRVTASARIAAAPTRVYEVLADYRQRHRHILPKRFSDLTVERGGRRRRHHHQVSAAPRRTPPDVPRSHHRTGSGPRPSGDESRRQGGGHHVHGDGRRRWRDVECDDRDRAAGATRDARRDRAFPHDAGAPATLPGTTAATRGIRGSVRRSLVSVASAVSGPSAPSRRLSSPLSDGFRLLCLPNRPFVPDTG